MLGLARHARFRRKVEDLYALGWRKKIYRSRFEWLIGTPTARPMKDGVEWLLRTPKRLVDVGFKTEFKIAEVETQTDLAAMNRSELVESFRKALKKWAEQKESAGYEAVAIRILPYSNIAKMLRGKAKKVRVTTVMFPIRLLVKSEEPRALAEISAQPARGGVRITFTPIIGSFPIKSALIRGRKESLKNASKKKMIEILKEELSKKGLKVLVVSERRKKRCKAPVEAYRDITPWDFTHKFLSIACARDEQDLLRVVKDTLMKAPPEKRGMLYSTIREIWPLLQARFQYFYMKSMEQWFKWTFKDIKQFLMPHDRCDNLDSFNEAFSVLARQCMFTRDEVIDIYPRARRYWLYKDAYYFLQRLLQIIG